MIPFLQLFIRQSDLHLYAGRVRHSSLPTWQLNNAPFRCYSPRKPIKWCDKQNAMNFISRLELDCQMGKCCRCYHTEIGVFCCDTSFHSLFSRMFTTSQHLRIKTFSHLKVNTSNSQTVTHDNVVWSKGPDQRVMPGVNLWCCIPTATALSSEDRPPQALG